MTRQEFIENINDWDSLVDFCRENDCDILDCVYDEYSMNEEIDYYIGEYLHEYTWQEFRDMLSEIPTGYEYYRENSAFNWDGLDGSDFRNYKEDVLAWMDDGGYWEENDNDEELFDGEDDDQDDAIAEEDFSVGDLIGICSATYMTIQKDAVHSECEDAAAFNQFIDINMPKVLR